MSEPAILVRGVSKFFGDFPALQDVELSINPGKVLALLGRNGAGKSTMLRLLAGLSTPTSGIISFPATDGEGGSPHSHIGVIGHGTWLYEELSAEENLQFFCDLYAVRNSSQVLTEWLEQVGLERFRHTQVREYSRGMLQRLTIARAFLHSPSILLLDEPWTSLDDRAMQLLSSLVLQARDEGRTVIVCSHQLHEALHVADDVALLHRGRIVYQDNSLERLRDNPELLYDKIQ